MAKRKAATCNSCGAEIVWLKMIRIDRDGTAVATPHPFDVDTIVVGVPGKNQGQPIGYWQSAYRSHFASCPNADAHRKREGS